MSAELSLLPVPRIRTEVASRLTDLAEQKMLSPARQAQYELRLLGATVLPQRQVIAQTQHGKWLFVDHVKDPTAEQYNGRIPIPASEYAKLELLDQVGVRPDVVWIGHQLPESWQAGQPVPVPAPKHLREKDQALALHIARGTELFLKGAGAVLAGAAAAPLALGAGLVSGVGMDPIVFGGVLHPQAPVVMWAALAQWEWE